MRRNTVIGIAILAVLLGVGIFDVFTFFFLGVSRAEPSKGLDCFQCHKKKGSREGTEDKGCKSCHEGFEVRSESKRARLLEFAQQVYGKREGYECALCHEGNPAAHTRAGAHLDLVADPARWNPDRRVGCAKCHFEDGSGKMTTVVTLPKPDRTPSVRLARGW